MNHDDSDTETIPDSFDSDEQTTHIITVGQSRSGIPTPDDTDTAFEGDGGGSQ